MIEIETDAVYKTAKSDMIQSNVPMGINKLSKISANWIEIL